MLGKESGRRSGLGTRLRRAVSAPRRTREGQTSQDSGGRWAQDSGTQRSPRAHWDASALRRFKSRCPTGMPAGIAPVASAPAGPNTHRPSPSRPFPACAVSICPSICLSVHVPVRLSACPSICLPGLLEWRVCEEWPQPAVCSQVRLPLVRGEGRGEGKRGREEG